MENRRTKTNMHIITENNGDKCYLFVKMIDIMIEKH